MHLKSKYKNMEELIKKVLNVIKRTFYKGRQNVFIKRLSSPAMK